MVLDPGTLDTLPSAPEPDTSPEEPSDGGPGALGALAAAGYLTGRLGADEAAPGPDQTEEETD